MTSLLYENGRIYILEKIYTINPLPVGLYVTVNNIPGKTSLVDVNRNYGEMDKAGRISEFNNATRKYKFKYKDGMKSDLNFEISDFRMNPDLVNVDYDIENSTITLSNKDGSSEKQAIVDGDTQDGKTDVVESPGGTPQGQIAVSNDVQGGKRMRKTKRKINKKRRSNKLR